MIGWIVAVVIVLFLAGNLILLWPKKRQRKPRKGQH